MPLDVVVILIHSGCMRRVSLSLCLVKDHFELAERLRANPDEVIEALKNLRQDNIIYLFRSDISGYWKVGLKKDFLGVLEEDSKAKL